MRHRLLTLPIILAAVQLVAQTTGGRIAGTILDRSAAVVRGARIVVKNADTAAERATESNAEGNYVLYPLQPGTYELTAQAPALRTQPLSAIHLDVSAVPTTNL